MTVQTPHSDNTPSPSLMPMAREASGFTQRYRVIRRDNSIAVFDPEKIGIAITKAFLAAEGSQAVDSSRLHQIVAQMTDKVVQKLIRFKGEGGTFLIEEIQDRVELELMRNQHHKVARLYVLYREKRAEERKANQVETTPDTDEQSITTIGDQGEEIPLSLNVIHGCLQQLVKDLPHIDIDSLGEEVVRNLYDGIPSKEILPAMILCTRARVEVEPSHSSLAARLLLLSLRQQAFAFVDMGFQSLPTLEEDAQNYQKYFSKYLAKAVDLELLDPKILEVFDIDRLAGCLQVKRDFSFDYHGLQTLYDRYLIHWGKIRFEMPQAFFMRVAMGLAMSEKSNHSDHAIEFYNLLSTFRFMSSTPTLFNSATLRPQLSSCYLTTFSDSLLGIYDCVKENALLSKFAGGLGNDWSRVRALGSHIKGTNGRSQGVVPFLKVANDTAVAVNQGGKRKGAVCAYLETWHLDIIEFIELRKNTGDDRRRTHDMNTANWIPDLFMQRVVEDGEWTLFSPDEVPHLHDLYGKPFAEAYVACEQAAERGEIKNFRKLQAKELWRKMLGMLYETGHPWITFKDPCNIRSPQQHAGVIHSSNLCTEITLNTNDEEIAVCNLGSINLADHIKDKKIDRPKLKATIQTAIRMLDNVIDYNYYSVDKAKNSNLKHRPIGLGLMGFQDALYKLGLSYDCDEAIEFADHSMEIISYEAISASMELAKERGQYPSFAGSFWSQGILPIDSLKNLQDHRGAFLAVDESQTLDWDSLRAEVKANGMRNSNVLAIAPTATISNICGVSQSIEPTYQNLFVKSNLSGEFTCINPYLVDELRQKDLWDEVLANDLKYFNGSIQEIGRIPADMKNIYKTAFEIDPCWLVEAASRRQKWIDQSQSLNLYMAEPDGNKLDNLYKLAWVRGLKTTYYLRSIGATHVEKSTLSGATDKSQLNSVKANGEAAGNGADGQGFAQKLCSIDDPDCEACQ